MKTHLLNLENETTLKKLSQDMHPNALCARVNGRLRELNYRLKGRQEIIFLDLSSRDAMRIYETSLRYMILKILFEKDPNIKVKFDYSISRSIYMSISGNKNNVDISSFLNRKLKDLSEQAIPIERITKTTKEIKKLYLDNNMTHKVKIFKYRDDEFSRVYKCEKYFNYLYGYMVPDTSYIKNFNVFSYNNGFIIQYPRSDLNGNIPVFKEEDKYKISLKKAAFWSKIINGDTIDRINDYSSSKIKSVSFIQMCESKHSSMLYELGHEISIRYDQLKLIAIAGPSSSGKTTFARRLEIELLSKGLNPIRISIDDYYLHPNEVPKDEKGKPDLEHINALDVIRFNNDIKSLINGETVLLPHFNFHTKQREKGKTLKLKKDQVILIEGIHALNEKLTSSISREKKYLIYISPQTQLHIDRESPIKSSDIRLLRRIVRDCVYRNTSAEETIAMWPSVRKGEFRWIYGNQKYADYIFNSELTYELSVLKKHAIKRLKIIDDSSPQFMKANYLLKFLKYIREIDNSFVPNQSLIREFIGGSVFE